MRNEDTISYLFREDIYWPVSPILQETAELQKKQAWYQQNQVSMQKDDEEEYLSYCSEAMFRIHILELRLQRYVLAIKTLEETTLQI